MLENNETYESVAYNKNLLFGIKEESTKVKKDRGIKGKVLLELFDAKTKEKVQEAYTENLIPDLFFKDTFLTHFAHGIMGVGNTRSSSNYSWFEYLYLTDHDKPENLNEQRVQGI